MTNCDEQTGPRRRGAPKGNRNAWKTGLHTAEMKDLRRRIRAWKARANAAMAAVDETLAPAALPSEAPAGVREGQPPEAPAGVQGGLPPEAPKERREGGRRKKAQNAKTIRRCGIGRPAGPSLQRPGPPGQAAPSGG